MWCRLAYWEGVTRVGELFPVTGSGVDVFLSSELPKGSGFSLDSVFGKEGTASEKVVSTRQKIGRGEERQTRDAVWLPLLSF